jgi:DNA-binding MarR family transcriptional regulator
MAGTSKEILSSHTALTREQLAEAAVIRTAVTRMGRRLRLERPSESIAIGKLNILGLLQRAGALTPGELAARERTQPQSLTRVLAELESEGLIVRETDPADRRRAIVRNTPAGTAALSKDMRERDVWLAAIMASELTPVERELLRLTAGLLERLADA